MAQLIRTSINLTAGGASGVTKPQGTLTYGSDGKYYVTDSGPSSPYVVGTGVSGSYSTTATTYISNGTWNNPLYNGENISMVLVFLLGGGGGGAAGPNSTTDTTYARGGGGGGASIMIYPAIALGPTYPITVGAAGSGGIANATVNGSSGGTTSFGHLPGSDDALLGGSAWFGTLYAGGGSGGTRVVAGTADAPGGNGLYIGSASSTVSVYLSSLWYSGPAGARGGGQLGISHPGGVSGYGFTGGINAPSINGGSAGASGAAAGQVGQAGGDGTNPDSTGIMRAGSAGGGGGVGVSANGGAGGSGGRGAGGGGGGAAPTGYTPGNGGNGGAGYAIIVSW